MHFFKNYKVNTIKFLLPIFILTNYTYAENVLNFTFEHNKQGDSEGIVVIDESKKENNGEIAYNTTIDDEHAPVFNFSKSLYIYNNLKNNKQTGVIVQDSDTLSITKDLTISFWLKLEKLEANKDVNFVAKNLNSSLYSTEYIFSLKSVTGAFCFKDNSSDNNAIFDTKANINKWQHISLVRDRNRSKLYLYINGELKETKDWYSQEGEDTDNGLIIGDNGYAGKIDCLQIYNEALNTQGIKNAMDCKGLLISTTDKVSRDIDITKMLRETTYTASGKAWIDANKNGIKDSGEGSMSGIFVYLYERETSEKIQSTMTDENGIYSFTNLASGEYIVKFGKPTEYIFTEKGVGSDNSINSDVYPSTGMTDIITISSANISALDAGLVKSNTTTYSLGDKLWIDTNSNGVQDSDEKGAKNIVVKLYKNGVATGASIVTDENGMYRFENLNPGKYAIEVVKTTLPSGYYFTKMDAGYDNDKDSDIDPATGKTKQVEIKDRSIRNLDVGITKNEIVYTYCLGDYVWNDTNNNGIQDSAERGVVNVDVELYRNGTSTEITTKTDTNGKYKFCKLEPGKYSVKFTAPKDYKFTLHNTGNDATNSDANPTTGMSGEITIINSDILTVDAGVYKPTPTATYSLGDKVWEDLNKNGIQDSNEKGILNVTVRLYKNGATAGIVTKTDIDGKYLFEDLEPGSYIIEVIKPVGYNVAKKDIGTNDSIDSDIDPVTFKSKVIEIEDKNINNIDIGLVKQPLPDIFISGTVYSDKNEDGNIDGISISNPDNTQLYITLVDNNGNVIASKAIDGNGKYQFTNNDGLKANMEYVVILSTMQNVARPKLPTNWTYKDGEKSQNTKINGNDGSPDGILVIQLGNQSIENNDFSISKKIVTTGVCLGGYIWYDKNLNGIQDEGDKYGVNGIQVHLYEENGISIAKDINGNLVNSVKANEDGKYQFCNIVEDKNYLIKLDIPEGFVSTVANQGNDSKIDSDANGQGVIVVENATTNMTLDIGVYYENGETEITSEDYNYSSRYDTKSGSAFNIFSILFTIFSLVLIANRRKEA